MTAQEVGYYGADECENYKAHDDPPESFVHGKTDGEAFEHEEE